MHFRRRVLESDYCIQQAADIISQVHAGDLPFDRTMKISTAENLSKETITDRMRANLQTLGKIIEANKTDWTRSRDTRLTDSTRRRAVRSLLAPAPPGGQAAGGAEPADQQDPAVDEEAPAHLREDGRVAAVHRRRGDQRHAPGRPGRDARGAGRADRPGPGRTGAAPQARQGHPEGLQRLRARPQGAVRGQPAPGRLHRQEVPQPGLELPRHHPGGQHRTDARGGQVRIPPRVQVLHLRHLVDSPGHHPRHRRPRPHHPHPGPHDRDDEQAPQRLQEARPGTGARADHRGDRRARPA